MKPRVVELRGYKSLRAFNAFHALMLGLKMLPSYQSEAYENFFARVADMPEADQEKLVREAAMFVELGRDEVEAMMAFCVDPNGVPYSAENLKNLNPAEIVEIIVAVSMAIAKIKIDLVSDDEKKK